MNIDELKQRKKELEEEIMQSISESLTKFKEETGVHPSSVNVYIEKIQTIGNQKPDFAVVGVDCDINS